MPLLLECPSGHRLKIPSKLAGHTIVCPVCEEKMDVPPLKAPPPAPAPLLRPVEKKVASAPTPPTPLPTQSVEEKKSESNATHQTKATLNDSVEDVTSHEDTRAEKPIVEEPQVESVVDEAPASLPVDPDVNVAKIADIPTLPDLPPPTESSPIDRTESEAHETTQHQPRELNHPVATEWDREEQPWSAMQTFDEPTQEISDSDIHPTSDVPSDELFSEEQSYLIDQVVAEAPAGPAWVFVDEAPSQTPVARAKAQPQNLSVFLLALAAVIVAILSIVPAVMDHIAAAQEGGSPDRWTYIVLLGALVQIAVAILVTSIPDWSTQWIGAIITTGFASMYALGLALTMFARQDHALVRDLGLLDEAFRNQAQPWCFFVLCMTLILAFCYGRASLHWYYTEKQFAVARG